MNHPTLRAALYGARFAFVALLPSGQASDIAVVTPPPHASPLERTAAQELREILQRLHPRDRFVAVPALPAAGKAILVGTGDSSEVRRLLGDASPRAAESYVVRRVADEARDIGVIAGADPRGAAYGVYALLEKLGCNFHLSGDALPPARDSAFGFAGWDFADRPLVRDRLVFNWHNFLSGCSTWNLAEWQHWTTQSQKMGYNAILVHAYGNNPMAGFTFEGTPKPVGYLSTTVKGRDWSTMHVNDVRRLHGGEGFSAPTFGAAAGLGPDAERVAAAQTLMQGVFAHAARRGMEVNFAIDVDTPSANPQELVRRLPESARFQVAGAANASGGAPGRLWVPNPDTPEGYAFFRAQVAGLMGVYPQITRLVVWFRRGVTPWMELKVTDFPPAWQQEFAAEVARTPGADNHWHAPGLFAVGKIVRAFARALPECGASRTQLAAGTWGFDFLPGADRFFPAGVALLGLDYDVLHDKPQLGTAASRAPLRAVGERRPVIPIVWAHHDDGHYVGRPYLPEETLASKLEDARAAGFGIIHWTTRPLDLFFSSLAKQVWSGTRDQPLAETCRTVAAAWFGEENRALLGEYLELWLRNAPRFGRETSDWFIDRKLTGIPELVAGCRARGQILAAVRVAGLNPAQRARLDYYRGLEEWMAAFHEGHGRFQESQERLARGDLAGARQALAGFQPGELIAQFARCSAHGGITRGEQGLVVSLNTRWLSHVVRHRQALGLEAVRIKLAPTSHDLLAQSRGTFTFHFDGSRALWECWGAEETGAEEVGLPANVKVQRGEVAAEWAEVGRTGIAAARPITLALRPIMAEANRRRGKALPLPAGDYRVRLLFLEPEEMTAGQRVFEVALRTGATQPEAAFTTLERVDIARLAGGAHRLIERVYSARLDKPSLAGIEVRLIPIVGAAVICGAVAEPVPSR